MSYTIKGYTVTTAEQVRSILVLAKLQGDARIVEQCKAVLSKFER